MDFKSYASGSSGNFYTLSDGETKIIIEAGIRISEIKKSLNFRLSEIAGVLISHSHKDHCLSVKEIIKAGLNVYMLEETREEIGIKHHRIKIIEPLKQFKIGTMNILPFDVQHDVKAVGFLIQDDKGIKFLYATDTYYIKYQFKNVSIIAVECNYSEEILEENILAGDVPVLMKKRLKKSHFSLENVKDFLLANDLRETKEIWLLHMSSRNSNPEMFKREIQAVTGKPVYIA